jgi:hypothetical protein
MVVTGGAHGDAYARRGEHLVPIANGFFGWVRVRRSSKLTPLNRPSRFKFRLQGSAAEYSTA